jgi:hypothetical protein
MDAAALVLGGLSTARSQLTGLNAPEAPGVYAFFLRDRGALPGVDEAADGIVYIGLSTNLAQREFDTHFRAGQSGFSTLRRTLGALLIADLSLKPRPRGSGASDSNYRCYRFDEAGEERLSAWMRDHLDIAVQTVADPKQLERALVALARPPLNLTLWANPDAATIRAARKACMRAARAVETR